MGSDICNKIQEQDSGKIQTYEENARKCMKKAHPNTETAKKAMQDIEAYNEPIACLDRIIARYGYCQALNCTKHPPVMNADTRSEVDARNCKDMDTTTLTDDPEQAKDATRKRNDKIS
ncbi:hypothetical protein AVEN_25375-1 [Araneus ventricosus]|uniref:Uncharacterized protein n=1 Tax=Araneus ventricosus TaxID=182803 RepID=A0A4Y2EF38_ARAVE|nr:hypothetical protein AVEN_25375-1 [Araneus ventricosus]